MKDYQKIITLSKPVATVYAAVTEHIADWWSNDLSGDASKAGDSFDIAFNKTKKTFSIIESIPNRKVVWRCDKAHIDMASLKNKAEWEGTTIIWTFNETSNGTELNFLHEGLNKSFECYDVCESGWDSFLGSFKEYVENKIGKPFLQKV